MGEAGEGDEKMGAMKPIGYCCSFLSLFGVILLGVLWWAEASYTERLGPPCKLNEQLNGKPVVCDHAKQHQNQEDAAQACWIAMIFYGVTFLLSLGCIFGAKSEDEKSKLVM